MKLPRFNRFLTVLNTAALVVVNDARSAWQEMTVSLGEGETRARYRYVPYGEFPVTLPDGRVVTQVIDRESATQIAANFGTLRMKIATFFKGIPIYEGHADDPQWCKDNPGHKASAVGRIKSIEPGEDGIYVESVFNSDGVSMLSGEAPAYSGHSARWRMVEVAGRPGCYRPVLLWSDALTDHPNIQECTMALNAVGLGELPEIDSPAEGNDAESENQETNDMKLTPEALAALGFAADATPSPDEISAAIVKMCGEKTSAEAAKVTAETAANTARTQLTNIRGAAVETVINAAVADGRITEADKPRWVEALNTDFNGEAAKLGKLMPVLNTQNRLPGLGAERGEQTAATVDAINAAVRAYAGEKSIDISTAAGWDQAFNGCKAAKPDLFKRTA